MRALIASLFIAVSATAALAQPTDLRQFVTGDDSQGWEGVGRLDIAGRAFCTGALISETLVLTAAHCLYDDETGARYPDGSINFLAGWRGGRASAYRTVRRAAVNPDYDYLGEDRTTRVAADIALLELDTPVRKSSVQPFDTGARPRKGAEVTVVSYAHDRAESPSIQDACKILGRQQGALVMNCTVDHGSSGAPIFLTRDGRAEIVSVVSAKAHVGDMPVSLGTGLDRVLDDLKAELATTDGMFTSVQGGLPPVNRGAQTTVRGSGAAGSAKFVRP